MSEKFESTPLKFNLKKAEVIPQGSIAVELEHEGRLIKTVVPAIYADLVASLPLSSMMFGSKKENLVDSYKLHAALGVGTKHSTWMDRMCAANELVEGEHYIRVTEDISDRSKWPEVRARGGHLKTSYMLLPRDACKIAVCSGTKMGNAVFDYMYFMADLGHDSFVAELKKVVEDRERALRAEKIVSVDALNERNKARDDLKPFTEKAGYPSVYSYQNERAKDEQIKKLRDDLALERQKCNMLENGMKYMRSSKWNQERCEKLFSIAQNSLELAEREGECYSDPY